MLVTIEATERGVDHTAHCGSRFRKSCCARTDPEKSVSAEITADNLIVLVGEGVV